MLEKGVASRVPHVFTVCDSICPERVKPSLLSEFAACHLLRQLRHDGDVQARCKLLAIAFPMVYSPRLAIQREVPSPPWTWLLTF